MQAYPVAAAPNAFAQTALSTAAGQPFMPNTFMPNTFMPMPNVANKLAFNPPLQQDVYMKQRPATLSNSVPAAAALPALPPVAGTLQGLPPAPEVLAPWLYFPMKNGSTSQVMPPAMQQGGMPSGISGYGTPAIPSAAAPSPQMPTNPEAMMPPAPEALPDAGAKALEKQQAEVDANAKPSSNGVSQEALIHGFDESLRVSLNARLEDPDWQKRGQAANEFFLTLQASPALAKNPATKPFIDAFALKILADPMSPVHTPMLIAMQTGYYTHPSQAVLQQLNRLKNMRGMLGLEPQQVSDALYALQQMQAAERAQVREQPVTDPATAPLTPGMAQAYPPASYPQGIDGLGSYSTPPLAASVPLQGLPASASSALSPPQQKGGFSLKRLWPFNRNSQAQWGSPQPGQANNGFNFDAGQRLNLLSAAGG